MYAGYKYLCHETNRKKSIRYCTHVLSKVKTISKHTYKGYLTEIDLLPDIIIHKRKHFNMPDSCSNGKLPVKHISVFFRSSRAIELNFPILEDCSAHLSIQLRKNMSPSITDVILMVETPSQQMSLHYVFLNY